MSQCSLNRSVKPLNIKVTLLHERESPHRGPLKQVLPDRFSLIEIIKTPVAISHLFDHTMEIIAVSTSP